MIDKFFRKLPLFKGKERLARFFFKNRIQYERNITVKGKYRCQYILPNIGENVGFEIYINGQYESNIQDLLVKLIPKNGVFLDLGANIGSILIPVCKRRPDIKAVAIEAAPWLFSYLERNVEINKLANSKLLSFALFDRDNCEMDFFSPEDKFGKGSLSPVFTASGVKVNTKKIDTVLAEMQLVGVDVIKIDVEGFEYFVFKGAEKLLQQIHAPIIVFEFVDWAEKRAMGLEPGTAQQYLVDNGYQLYAIKGGKVEKIEKPFVSGACNLIASKMLLKIN
jgi:FkbM family methyltransferase